VRKPKSFQELVSAAVFAQRNGRPLYIHIVFLVGQVLIAFGPLFPLLVIFDAFITRLPWTLFAALGGVAQVVLVSLAFWCYMRFSRAIRRFLARLIEGMPVDADLATEAWLEAVAYPQRVIVPVVAAFVPVYGLEVLLFAPRIGLIAALESFAVIVVVGVWFALVLFLFYLEWAMRPIVRMALDAGASPALDRPKLRRLLLGTKLQVLTLGIIVVPVTIVGVFAYSQVVALGGEPFRVLWPIVLVATLATGAAIGQSFLLVRSVVTPVRELQRVIERVGHGDYRERVTTVTTDELAELGLQFNRMVGKLRQNEELAAAFGRYVSPAVRDGILSGQIALGGERREITILFSDVRNFTAWCEREEPEDVIQTLNVYYGFLVQALIRRGGTVTRYTGDGVLALFGAPLPDPDHALHAVQAAWEASTLLDKFNDIRSTVGAFELRTGFGIHSGMAVVGSIGTEARAEYTPIGDAANVASRIEGLNKELGTSILISDDTYQRVADYVEVGRRAEVMVKGRSQPVRVVEVVGLK